MQIHIHIRARSHTHTHTHAHKHTHIHTHTTHTHTQVFQATSLVVSDLKKMLNDTTFKKVAVSSDRYIFSTALSAVNICSNICCKYLL